MLRFERFLAHVFNISESLGKDEIYFVSFHRLEAPTAKERDVIERTHQHLNHYATLGLRVLAMSKRVLTDAEYEEWVAEHNEAEVRQIFSFVS